MPLRRKAGILLLPERLGPFILGGGSVAGRRVAVLSCGEGNLYAFPFSEIQST